ncbi:YceD family protein [Pleomorphomonas carboxyditropha]|uniref:DUF177 domain-containing protein n=1 Tax=Pleomorphomonas carboxyditropha TaxID=2023338 RepID=A0A2G9X301_9HYPH|nr:DUF177 domain-containing protein [Pleomorphomonas carboxyditropha]PIP00933.1 hypothetical protein CJ014_02220 [Pleomorphomonas carboxyditropha]
MTAKADIPLSRRFAWDRVQPRGTPVAFEASPSECEAIADALGILKVASASAEFTISPFRKTGFKVTGEVRAEVEQACVVTLEPVPESIREAVDLRFLPESEIEPAGEEIEVDVDAEDPPEPILGASVDLGVLTTEFIAVGLDPYPRKPGVEFTPFIEDDGGDDEGESPFAGLAALKDKSP